MKSGILQMPNAFFVLAFIAFSVSGSLCLRVAGDRGGAQGIYFFAAGNVIGFIGTIFLTLALRAHQPNITYALCQGGAFCVLQLAAFLIFRVPLTTVQWLGVSLIACGVCCVQVRF